MLRFGCPIYIAEDILEKAQLTNAPSDTEISGEDESADTFIPDSKYSTYSDEELFKMIDEAVKKEDYEQAASIRDEIEKRQKKKS